MIAHAHERIVSVPTSELLRLLMPFQTLEDAERAFNDLKAKVDVQMTIHEATAVVVDSLIATHHDYEELQRYIASILDERFGKDQSLM